MKTHANQTASAATKRRISGSLRILPLLIAGCFHHGAALANPSGAQVVAGQVGMTSQNNLLTITNSPGAIINWQNFSIGAGEITRFVQQNSTSSVLNRVIGQNPTQILGALQSNGRVFLINPSGILFGQGAQVDVNGLVASTLNIGNEDFLAGRLKFTAGENGGKSIGKVQNQGSITTPSGGQVFLIAPNVENSGIITSPKGEVVLAAGHSVQLVDSGDPDLHVVVSAPENQAINLGQIVAQSGKIGIYGALINQRGLVSANSAVVGENGKIVFKSSGDTILDAGSVTSATGAGKGGDIHILGERVGLADGSSVDASGLTGGGTVLVGGDYHGENTNIQNASRVFFGKEAVIKADAIDSGDGGKVVLWSDQVTRAFGKISARGGAQSGNGGFVEVSSKQYLDFRSKVDVGAPAGKNGTLLLDPATITLVGGTGDGASGPDGTGTFQGFSTPGTVNFSDPDLTAAGVSNIYQSELEGIAPGTNIMLEATDYISATGSFGNLVTLPANSNLVMRTRNAATDGSGAIGINLVGSTDGVNLEFRTQGSGTIILQTGVGSSPQAANIDVGKLTTAGGSVTVSGSGNAVIRGVTTTPGGAGNGGDISITSGGFMTLGGSDIDARGNSGASGNVTLNSGGAITMQNGQTIYGNQLKMTATGGITDGAAGAVSTQVSALNASNSGTGPISIRNSGGSLTISDIGSVGYGIRQTTAGQGIDILTGTGETLNIAAPITTSNGAVTLNSQGAINLLGSNSIASGGGQISLNASGSEAMLSLAPGSGIDSGGGQIFLRADKMSLGGSPGSINAGANKVTLNVFAAPAISLGAIGDGTVQTLELSNAELNTVSAGTLYIGSSDGGSIAVTGAIAPAGVSSLSLQSVGGITQQPGATISAPALRLSGSSVTLLEANSAGTIAGAISGGNGDFQYRSANALNVASVDGQVGLTVNNGGSILLWTDSGSGISQTSPIVATNALALKSIGPVNLTNTSNSISMLGADLNLGGSGTGAFNVFSASNMSIGGPYFGIAGISTNNQNISLATGTGSTLTVGAPISAGAGKVALAVDDLVLSSTIVGTDTSLRPNTAGRPITVGGACIGGAGTCLSLSNLYNINSATLGIGTQNGANAPGAIYVAGITTGGSGATDLNANTTRVGLMSGAGVTQGGSISVPELAIASGGAVNLPMANAVSNLAGTGANGFSFANAQNLTVGALSGASAAPHNYSLTGISSGAGAIALSTTSGNLMLNAVVNAGANSVGLTATAGAIRTGGGTISGSSLNASSGTGIGIVGTPLLTQVASLSASNTGLNSDIVITNTGALTINNVSQPVGSTGNITLNNTGAITVAGPVSTAAGAIDIVAHSPLTVNGSITSATGPITLEAGASGNVTDKLTIAASGVVTTGGNVVLKAGDAIIVSGTVTGATVTQQANLNAPPLPTLAQCIANPALAGCSQVLPTLTQCIATPTLAGCSVVLPTLAQCTATPTLTGCSVVLPTLTQCIATPTLAGCSVVLPTLAQCATTPTLPGCSVVLPTLAQCTATPTLDGCSAVLPSVAACTVTPTLAGCNVVLPSLTQCVAIPSLPGCSVILPTIAACTTTPTLPGCSAVLPSVAACSTSPSLPGCSVVLPTLTQCTLTPTLAGCNVVLPPLSTCIANPTAAGCGTVLPSLTQCIATPALAGCAIVLPPLSQCTASPALAGCGAVLPSLAQCMTAPTLSGCSVVLPGISACISTPNLPGCSVVLPSLTTCAATPTLPGCSVVLPLLSQCVASPSLAGCSVILPTLAQCMSAPTLAGCSVILPTVAQCTSAPTLAGCQVVLPPIQTQTPSNNPITQTINNTINLVNTSTTTLSNLTGTATNMTNTGTGGKDDKTSDTKTDDKKTDVVGTDKTGVKNEPTKKLYCN